MKKIFAFLIPLMLFGCASTFQLGWTHSNPGVVARYAIHATTNVTLPVLQWPVFTNAVPPNLSIEVSTLGTGRYYIYATAISTNSIESDPSNIVIADIPDSPKVLRIIIVP